jgi:hypothetical protein
VLCHAFCFLDWIETATGPLSVIADAPAWLPHHIVEASTNGRGSKRNAQFCIAQMRLVPLI